MSAPHRLLVSLLFASSAVATACNGGSAPAPAATAEPADPRTIFEVLPTEVTYDPARVALGNQLFHDPGLSVDGTLSCASCHSIANGGDDGRPSSLGVNGQIGPINAPTVLNSRYMLAQFWDGRAADLHAQAMGPMTNPGEMGGTEAHVTSYVRSVPEYVQQFEAAGYGEVTFSNIAEAIAAFEDTLVTPSRFDAYLRGDDEALSEQEFAGLQTFIDVGCTACHMGPAIGGTMFQKMGLVQNYFEQRGGPLTDADLGRFNVTHDEAQRYFFKVPTLRNVERTSPYFHDGSVARLEDAVTTMGRVQLGRDLTDEQTANLVAFLHSLTAEPIALAGIAIPPELPVHPAPVDGEVAPPIDPAANPAGETELK